MAKDRDGIGGWHCVVSAVLVQKYPFDNPPPMNMLIDESKIVGVDKDNRPIQLNRVFVKVLPGVLVPLQYEALLGNPL